MEKIQERALKCVYSNHTASYESLLYKARLPSLEVGRQMNIAIQTFKTLNDLSPTYLLELIEKRCRTRNLGNSENSSHEDMEQIPFAFWPQQSGTLCQRH